MRRSRMQNFPNSEAREASLLTNLDRTELLLDELNAIDEEVAAQSDLEFSADNIELIYIRNLVRFIRCVIREQHADQPRAVHASENLSRLNKWNQNHFRGHGFSAS